MFKLLRKMRERIGYASLPQVWFNRGQKTRGGGYTSPQRGGLNAGRSGPMWHHDNMDPQQDGIDRRHVVCFVSKFDHATILCMCVHRRHLTLFGMIG